MKPPRNMTAAGEHAMKAGRIELPPLTRFYLDEIKLMQKKKKKSRRRVKT